MRSRLVQVLFLLGTLPAVSANPIIDIIVGLGDFTRRFSFAGEMAFVGLVALALFVLYLILFQMVFRAINRNNQNASPRLVNAGIIVFSAILAIFSSVNLPREALRALVQQYTVLGYILLGIVVPFGIIAFAVYLKHKHKDNPGVSVGAGILLVLLGLNLTSAIDGLGAVGLDGTVFWLTLIQWIVIGAGAWMALSPLFGLFSGLGFGLGGSGPGGSGAGGSGPGGARRARPNQVQGIRLSTVPDPAMDARPPDQRRYAVKIEWSVPPATVNSENINNFQVRVKPSRFVPQSGYRNPLRPFQRPKYFPTNTSPFVIPHPNNEDMRYPLNSEIGINVRAGNTAGWGPWSTMAVIAVGADLGAPAPPVRGVDFHINFVGLRNVPQGLPMTRFAVSADGTIRDPNPPHDEIHIFSDDEIWLDVTPIGTRTFDIWQSHTVRLIHPNNTVTVELGPGGQSLLQYCAAAPAVCNQNHVFFRLPPGTNTGFSGDHRIEYEPRMN